LLRKMPGDEWQQAANLRAYTAFMYGHPGKKLNFMGNEIGQASEWNHDSSINWHLLEFEKHKGIQLLYKDLNKLYSSYPALHECDHHHSGFEWIDHGNAEQSILSMLRKSAQQQQKVYVVTNFTPVSYENFLLGVQDAGNYQLLLNTDDKKYWGSGFKVVKKMQAQDKSWNNQPASISLNLPPLASLFIIYKG
jgi:1,4-alpha-glucan branching enzyme